MKTGEKQVFVVGGFLILGFSLWATYETLIAGTTRGPDFIAGLQSGNIPISAVRSIEIVDFGRGAFAKREFDALTVRRVVQSPIEQTKIMSHVANSTLGQVHLNHPSTRARAYLKVNTGSDFYWLYVYVLDDHTKSVLMIESNTCNATNPNGASTYHLKNGSELLSLIDERAAAVGD